MILLLRKGRKYGSIVVAFLFLCSLFQAFVGSILQSSNVLSHASDKTVWHPENRSIYNKTTRAPSTPHWRPTKKWVQQCISAQKKKSSKPFNVVWRRYVLGDCIKLCRNCYFRKCVVHPEKAKQRGSGCFEKATRNDTFSALYHFRACRAGLHEPYGNLTIVDQILKEASDMKSFQKPPPTALVIHLRLGDVIEESNASVQNMLMRGADPWHSTAYKAAIKSISEYLDEIEAAHVTDVVIRGGSHDPTYFQKSRIYASCLHRAIQKAGYRNATMKIEGIDPDHDFFYMSSAKYLSVSTGGFSRLMGTIVKRNGGKIVGRRFVEDDH